MYKSTEIKKINEIKARLARIKTKNFKDGLLLHEHVLYVNI